MEIPILSFVEAEDHTSWANRNGSRKYKIVNHEYRETLATLRLVNKAFCQCASARFFRHIIATYDNDVSQAARLRDISNSPYAPYVRHIEFGFRPYTIWLEDLDLDTTTYVEDLAGLLSPSLIRFPNLSSLEFTGAGEEVPQELKNKLMGSVTSALRYVSMPALEELDISFPIAHDFGQLFYDRAGSARIPIASVLRRLRHLGLHLRQWTSHDGQRRRARDVTPENAALPNETFAVNILKMINLAENIQSLEITSTNILNFDNATFSPSLRLRSLDLCRVSISARTLLDLMGSWRDSIRYIQLWEVELNAGTWKDVLVKLSMLPGLIDFQIENSGYSAAGSSSELRPRLRPEIGDSQQLETVHFSDIPALAILQHRVNANRLAAGLAEISHNTYRAAKLYSMKSAIAITPG